MQETSDSSARTPHRCPTWCDGVVCREALPADRYHQHDVIVPVISRVPPDQNHTVATARVEELHIALFSGASQETEDGDIWIVLEMAGVPRGVTLSLESMWRVYRGLGEVLGRMTCFVER